MRCDFRQASVWYGGVFERKHKISKSGGFAVGVRNPRKVSKKLIALRTNLAIPPLAAKEERKFCPSLTLAITAVYLEVTHTQHTRKRGGGGTREC